MEWPPPDGIAMCQVGGVVNAKMRKGRPWNKLSSSGSIWRRTAFSSRIIGAEQPRATVAMEACGGAHHWGREIGGLGHAVRLIPPVYVKPYVKRQKNDAADAEAICEGPRGRPCGLWL